MDIPQNKYELNFKRGIYFLFFFFVFFPFISPVKTSTDMQPYSVIFAIILLPFFKLTITKSQLLILLLPLLAILMLIFSDFSFNSFRSLYNYISLFIIYYVSFKVLKSNILNIETVIKIFFSAWVTIGVLQTTIKKDLFTFLISDSRTTENRGVTSLAPEPTFFAIILFFFLLYFFHLNIKNKKTYYIVIVLSILLIAKSSMGLVYLLILFIYLLITNLSLKHFFATILLISLLSLSLSYFVDSRLYGLVIVFIESPSNLLTLDASINDRFFQIFFSIKGFFQFYLFPHGFSYWGKYLAVEVPKYSEYVMVDFFSSDGRIMSGLGSLLFELGLFGLLLPLLIFKQNIFLFRNNITNILFVFILIFLLLISAIPIGFSYFGFYLAFIEYIKFEKHKLIL
jgi:hypothetical protein